MIVFDESVFHDSLKPDSQFKSLLIVIFNYMDDLIPSLLWTPQQFNELSKRLGIPEIKDYHSWAAFWNIFPSNLGKPLKGDVPFFKWLAKRYHLDQIVVWQNEIYAAMEDLSEQQFLDWVSGWLLHVEDFSNERLELLLQYKHNCTLKLLCNTDELRLEPCFCLVDAKVVILCKDLQFFFPTMTPRQVFTFIDSYAAPLNWETHGTKTLSKYLAEIGDERNEESLIIELRLLALKARVQLLDSGFNVDDWLLKAGGEELLDVYKRHLSGFKNYSTQIPADRFGLNEFLNSINSVSLISTMSIRRAVRCAENQLDRVDQPYLMTLKQLLDEILESRSVKGGYSCTVTSLIQSFGYGKSKLIEQHIPGHCLIKIDCQGNGLRPLDRYFRSLFIERIHTVDDLKLFLIQLGVIVDNFLCTNISIPQKCIRLNDLIAEENLERELFVSKKEFSARPGQINLFPWIVLDDAMQLIGGKVKLVPGKNITTIEALRLVMSNLYGQENPYLNSFGVLLIDSKCDIDFYQPTISDYVFEYLRDNEKILDLRMPPPLIFDQNFDILQGAIVDGKRVRTTLYEVHDWNRLIWSKRYLDGLTFLGRPIFGSMFLGYFRNLPALYNLDDDRSTLDDICARKMVRDYVRFQMCGQKEWIANNIVCSFESRTRPLNVSEEEWNLRDNILDVLTVQAFSLICGALVHSLPQTSANILYLPVAFVHSYQPSTRNLLIWHRSEPVLCGFADSLIAQPVIFGKMLKSLIAMIENSKIELNRRCEYLAKMLIIKCLVHAKNEKLPESTSDDFLGSRPLSQVANERSPVTISGASKFFTPVTVDGFLRKLVGQRRYVELRRELLRYEVLQGLLKGNIAASHFVHLEDEIFDENILIRDAISRNAAISGYHLMSPADELIPIIKGSGRLSLIFISIFDDYFFKMTDLNSRNLPEAFKRLLRCMTPEKVFKNCPSSDADFCWVGKGGDVRSEPPYIRIIFCLKGQGPEECKRSRIFFDLSDDYLDIVILGVGGKSGPRSPFASLTKSQRRSIIKLFN